jgi:tetratricopeptide (TPR) repeat protein
MVDTPRIEELRRRIAHDPASLAFAALAEEYRRGGLFDEAIATCEAGLQRHPSYLSARVTLGRALIEAGRHEEAREQLEFVVRAAPENLAAIRGLAEIHHRRRDAEFRQPPDPPIAGAAVEHPAHPGFDAQVHALEAFLHAVERTRTAAPAAL